MSNWNGVGLPPVGTAGTADFHKSIGPISDIDRFIGEAVTVVGHFETEDGKKGVVISHKTKGVGAVMHYQEGIIKPIKSDRDKAIEDLVRLYHESPSVDMKEVFGFIYDAGYRKQSGG